MCLMAFSKNALAKNGVEKQSLPKRTFFSDRGHLIKNAFLSQESKEFCLPTLLVIVGGLI